MIGKKVCGSGGWGRAGGAIEERLPHLGGGLPAAAEPSADLLGAQLANAEADRLDALEEAECAVEDCDGYRRELARVRAQVRDLEAQLRTERHEHAETRARLSRTERERDDARDWADTKDHSHGLAIGREQDMRQRIAEAIALLTTCTRQPPTAYDLNPTAAQLSRLEPR